MKDQAWTTKIIATVITGGALALSVWIFQSVQKHDMQFERQEARIRALEEKITELKEYIKGVLTEIKVDVKELRKQADKGNIKVGQL